MNIHISMFTLKCGISPSYGSEKTHLSKCIEWFNVAYSRSTGLCVQPQRRLIPIAICLYNQLVRLTIFRPIFSMGVPRYKGTLLHKAAWYSELLRVSNVRVIYVQVTRAESSTIFIFRSIEFIRRPWANSSGRGKLDK